MCNRAAGTAATLHSKAPGRRCGQEEGRRGARDEPTARRHGVSAPRHDCRLTVGVRVMTGVVPSNARSPTESTETWSPERARPWTKHLLVFFGCGFRIAALSGAMWDRSRRGSSSREAPRGAEIWTIRWCDPNRPKDLLPISPDSSSRRRGRRVSRAVRACAVGFAGAAGPTQNTCVTSIVTDQKTKGRPCGALRSLFPPKGYCRSLHTRAADAQKLSAKAEDALASCGTGTLRCVRGRLR